jgi:hypothetical protein
LSGDVKNDGNLSIRLDTIEPLTETRARRAPAVRIVVSGDDVPDDFYGSLGRELSKFPGGLTVLIDLRTKDEQALLKMRTVKVSMAQDLADKISSISGGGASVVL